LASDLETKLRGIGLTVQSNFRDLGGYRSADGRRVRFGQLYRSGELCEISGEDAERLAELGLRTVIDLRSQREVEAKGPDRLPDGAEVVNVAIDPGDLGPIVNPAFVSGDFSGIPPDLLHGINRSYVHECRPQLGTLLSLAADPARRPLVFHCTQGKDRAGIVAAILLSTLGIPWEGVLEDYLLSNTQRRAAATAGLDTLGRQSARKRGIEPDEVDLTNIRGLFFVDPAYLGAARDEIHTIYGSVGAFIEEGLGWSGSELARLRDELLE
jgi:protein-tyrosine phosphatase